MASGEALKYWLNGLPYGNLGGGDPGGFKYWFNGVPFVTQPSEAEGGTNVSVAATGVSAASALGTATAAVAINVSVAASGVAASTALGTATAIGFALNPEGWDSRRDYGGKVIYSNSDRTATGAPDLPTADILSVISHSSGRRFAEVTYAAGSWVGIHNPSYDGAYLMPNGGVTVYLDDASEEVIYPAVFPPLVDGDVVGIAVDIDAGKVWFRVNGGLWNNDPGQEPTTYWTDDLAQYIDPTVAATITGSPVVEIRSPDTQGFAVAPRFEQSVSVSSRPAITASRLVFDGTNDYLDGSAGYNTAVNVTLPDPFYAEAGKGPTCTGLARASDGSWWVGHYGKKHETTAGSETFNTSLIHYSSDFSTLIQEIRCTEEMGIATVAGIQGVAIDEAANEIFFSDLVRLYSVNLATNAIRLNVAKTAGGLALNPLTNELLAWTSSSTVTRVNKTTGANIGTFTIRDGNDRDHLFFDPGYGAAGALYTTCRANGTNGRVVKYDFASKAPVKAWSLVGARAIEGIVVVGNRIYVCTDEYYHATGNLINHVAYVDVDIASADYGSNLTIGWVGKVTATPAAVVAQFHGGDAINLKGIGVFYTTVANQLQVLARFDSTLATLNYAIGSTTTEYIGALEIDTVAHTASLYINGTLIEAKTDALLTGSIPSLLWTLGASYETSALASRFCNGSLGGFVVAPNTEFRDEIEGHLAWQTGNQSLLPVGHAYKGGPP